ncbi:MAG TPA: protein-L-isoaspartate(D-aspartate) O-methyltransferase [Acidobacteriota bacterium]|nr:protein-L-isoaspartate(D-aspartate) O-methyltransferase [Acidobacteriota bacterium]
MTRRELQDAQLSPEDERFARARRIMVEQQLVRRGIKDRAVLEAFTKVPRHLFVPEHIREEAYRDGPLPIGHGQTISQPYMVAIMTELARIRPGDKVLEVGTGSGYQAAILAELGARVYSIERLPELADRAKETLESLGYSVCIRVGDGSEGWPEEAPFDRILVTAGAPSLPDPLVAQLAMGGRLLVPVDDGFSQILCVAEKTPDGLMVEHHDRCAFVPLIGRYGWQA